MMKWLESNMELVKSVLQSLWYLVFVASAIILILIGTGDGIVVATVLGVAGILIILCNETLKAFEALKR